MLTPFTDRALPLLLTLAIALTSACGGATPESAQTPAPHEPDYVPTATIKDLMQGLVDTNADVVWLAVTTVHSEKGIEETSPQTEEEWIKVRHGAVALAESANLLMVPGRRVARPGEKSETPGVELEPEEMQVMIDKDREAWDQRARDLNAAAVAALAAIDARDPDKLFELGASIELACENCHTHYWYPNEKIPEVQFDLTEGDSSR